MKNRILIALALVLFLNGCALFQKKISPIVPPDKAVNIDPKVLEPCKPLVPLAASATEFTDILMNTAINSKIYAECKGKQDTSIVIIKQLTNK